MTVVVDSNILIAYTLADEPLHIQAKAALSDWMATGTHLCAPRLFRSEITAVIRKAVYQERITSQRGRVMLQGLLAYPIEYQEDDRLLLEAYEIASRFNMPRTYDAQYLALSKRLACEFWSADKTLVNSIERQFGTIRWLGDFAPQESP